MAWYVKQEDMKHDEPNTFGLNDSTLALLRLMLARERRRLLVVGIIFGCLAACSGAALAYFSFTQSYTITG